MFNKARLKLTVWYLLILMLISVSFSTVVYKILSSEIDRFSSLQKARLEQKVRRLPYPPDLNNLPPISLDQELVEDIKRRLLFFLFFINSGVLIFAGSLSYFLSGRTLEPIEEMVERQKQFVSDASHELRTPLTSLKTSIEVGLKDKNLNLKESKLLLKDNLEDVNRLQQLTEDLLILSRYEANGVKKTNFVKTSFSLIFKEALRQVKSLAQEKSIEIKEDIEDSNFKADVESLIRLLVILLDNAIKYSHKGGMVEVKSQLVGKLLVFKVKDYGVGIRKKDLKHIFDRFYRADTSRQMGKTYGFGLGLSVAKQIVESYKGEIEVESKFDKGSVFKVKLPIVSV